MAVLPAGRQIRIGRLFGVMCRAVVLGLAWGVMFAPFVETLLAVCSDPSDASGGWQERGVVEQHQAEALDDVWIELRARATAQLL
jgi:hypothetical protein